MCVFFGGGSNLFFIRGGEDIFLGGGGMGYPVVFMPPTLKKWGAYWFRLVRSSVRSSGQNRIQASVLKFHIWIPHQKKTYPYFFSCPNYLPLPSYAPLKG